MEYFSKQILDMGEEEINKTFYKQFVKGLLADSLEICGIVEEIGISVNGEHLPVTIKVKGRNIDVLRINKIICYE